MFMEASWQQAAAVFQPLLVAETMTIQGGMLRKAMPLPVVPFGESFYVCTDASEWMRRVILLVSHSWNRRVQRTDAHCMLRLFHVVFTYVRWHLQLRFVCV